MTSPLVVNAFPQYLVDRAGPRVDPMRLDPRFIGPVLFVRPEVSTGLPVTDGLGIVDRVQRFFGAWFAPVNPDPAVTPGTQGGNQVRDEGEIFDMPEDRAPYVPMQLSPAIGVLAIAAGVAVWWKLR